MITFGNGTMHRHGPLARSPWLSIRLTNLMTSLFGATSTFLLATGSYSLIALALAATTCTSLQLDELQFGSADV